MRATPSSSFRLASLIAVTALVVGACGAATPAISDPKEILTKAVEALQNAKSVHLVATLDGQFVIDLTGTGNGGSVTLSGTKLEGDIDVANKKVKATFAVPALLGLTGEVIALDNTSYIKTSLTTGDLYQKSEAGSSLPVNPTDPQATLNEVRTWLAKPEVSPTKGDDADCGGKKCYVVTIEMTGAELAALSSPSPDSTIDPSSTFNLTFKVEKDPVRLSELTAEVAMGAQGTLTIVLTLSKWDESVTIDAPPDDQVTEGSPLPF
jgi:hypothetical protein